VLIPRSTEESIPRLGREQKYAENISFKKQPKNSPYLRSRRMLRNGIPRFCFYFVPRNGIPSIFLFRGMAWNGILSIFLFRGMVRTGIPRVCFYFDPLYRIPSILVSHGMVRNGIPRVFCSAERPEFRRNKPIVSSIPSSAE
jgi:hypothetical protein